MAFHRLVYHVCLRRRAEHLAHCQVKRSYTVCLLESEAMVPRRFTHHIHRCTFTFSHFAYMFQRFLLNQESHALLTLVGNDLLWRKRFVTDRKLVHLNETAAIFYQFRETVHVSCCSVIMDRYHWILVFLTKGTHHVVGTLLHLGIGTLYGIQFHTVAIASRVHRRHRTTT